MAHDDSGWIAVICPLQCAESQQWVESSTYLSGWRWVFNWLLGVRSLTACFLLRLQWQSHLVPYFLTPVFACLAACFSMNFWSLVGRFTDFEQHLPNQPARRWQKAGEGTTRASTQSGRLLESSAAGLTPHKLPVTESESEIAMTYSPLRTSHAFLEFSSQPCARQ